MMKVEPQISFEAAVQPNLDKRCSLSGPCETKHHIPEDLSLQ